jgi:hypothetical protein
MARPAGLTGFVSDENYLALADVAVEFQRPSGECVALVRSSPRGAIYADVKPGDYFITLSKTGFGPKRVRRQLARGAPIQLRLLSDSLYGYAWPKWVRGGQAGEVRVHAIEPYHLSLWRYGLKKEPVAKLGWFDEHGPRTNAQILPDGDFSQAGVVWNRAAYKSVPRVIAPPRSGLYYFHVETASGAFLSFPWVVAPPAGKPQAPVAVLASTNTWNAYNNFGGRSNYINPAGLPPTPTVNARLDLARYAHAEGVWSSPDQAYLPLSFDRPEPFNTIARETQATDPIRGRQACHLAEAEWRLLAWLDREGISCDLYSDYQLHAGELDLDAYRVLVLSTHPEYWSAEAYRRVKEWVLHCEGKLMYLGGNGIDCEVEFSEDTVMRCKTWLPTPAGVPFRDAKTGTAYDCRFHHKVESPANLLGVVFTEAGAASAAAPYRVVEPSHWIFAGTNLAGGDEFGSQSLHERCPGGASGHETDKRTASSPADFVLLAKGTNPGDGGAEMVYRETAGGGAVFSVGSITWPACLLVDGNVATITRNVLARFLNR